MMLILCLCFVALPLLSGVTVAGYGNGVGGTANNALQNPYGLALGIDGSLFISDFTNHRVMRVQEGSLIGSIVAGTGVSGNAVTQLNAPTELAVDSSSNIYVNDDFNCRVMLWRKNSSVGVIVAGTGTCGSTANTISYSVGLTVDSQGNMYVADYSNHRVMKWAPNATSGILVAGTGVAGSTNQQLNQPYGLYLDENNSYIYIADSMNHRVQRYRLGNASIGTTMAGGTGQGLNNNQLDRPYDVCVSKTGDIYVADKNNHRIQRWSPGATVGVTIIGITALSGSNATLLYGPSNVVLSLNETFLYVSDNDNHRVQRFKIT